MQVLGLCGFELSGPLVQIHGFFNVAAVVSVKLGSIEMEYSYFSWRFEYLRPST